MRVRDKDCIITEEGLVFNVIGYNHPAGKAIALLKAIPFMTGHKKILELSQKSVAETVAMIKEKYPKYLHADPAFGGDISAVPEDRTFKILRPEEKMAELLESEERDELQERAVDLAGLLAELYQIPIEKFGLTGSLLYGNQRPDSDIDLVVYGKSNINKIRANPDLIWKYGPRPVKSEFFQRYYSKYHEKYAAISLSEFEKLAARKSNIGYLDDTRFVLLGVRDWDEITRSEKIVPAGPTTVAARVSDDSEALFFPAIYSLENVRVDGTKEERPYKLVSYDHFYANVFRIGDEIEVQAKLESSISGKQRFITLGSYQLYGKEYAKLI